MQARSTFKCSRPFLVGKFCPQTRTMHRCCRLVVIGPQRTGWGEIFHSWARARAASDRARFSAPGCARPSTIGVRCFRGLALRSARTPASNKRLRSSAEETGGFVLRFALFVMEHYSLCVLQLIYSSHFRMSC